MKNRLFTLIAFLGLAGCSNLESDFWACKKETLQVKPENAFDYQYACMLAKGYRHKDENCSGPNCYTKLPKFF